MKLKRIHDIEEYINEKETVSLVELSKKFDVSINTIRRDINYLEENGAIKKVYGGVTSTDGHQLTSFDFRTTKQQKEKNLIAKEASKLIEDGDLIFIDSGTTTSQILKHVDSKLSFTVLTNNLDVMIEASSHNNIELIVLGSRYYPKTRSFLKTNTSNDVEYYNISKAFMAATGVSITNGLTNSDFHEHEIKKSVTDRASQVYILADSSKFGKATLLTYSQLNDVNKVITDKKLDQSFIDFFTKHEIELLYTTKNNP